MAATTHQLQHNGDAMHTFTSTSHLTDGRDFRGGPVVRLEATADTGTVLLVNDLGTLAVWVESLDRPMTLLEARAVSDTLADHLPVGWRLSHEALDPEADGWGYAIEVKKVNEPYGVAATVDTLAQALRVIGKGARGGLSRKRSWPTIVEHVRGYAADVCSA